MIVWVGRMPRIALLVCMWHTRWCQIKTTVDSISHRKTKTKCYDIYPTVVYVHTPVADLSSPPSVLYSKLIYRATVNFVRHFWPEDSTEELVLLFCFDELCTYLLCLQVQLVVLHQSQFLWFHGCVSCPVGELRGQLHLWVPDRVLSKLSPLHTVIL